MSCKEVYISLGSNVGDRRKNIENALEKIKKICRIKRVSSFYETAPWGYIEQDRFYNAAACLETDLQPEVLLDKLLEIETAGSRVRTFKYAPRTIDIDILLVEDFSSDTAKLKVPHPLMKERAFVLLPLSEIADSAFEEKYGFRPEALVKKEDLEGITKLA